jgi:hypothetical protein
MLGWTKMRFEKQLAATIMTEFRSQTSWLPADFGNAGMDKDEIEELQEALLRECDQCLTHV